MGRKKSKNSAAAKAKADAIPHGAVVVGGADSQMATMVAKVHEMCPTAKTDTIQKLLISFNYDVSRTIDSIVSGSGEGLDEWSTTATKKKPKKKAKGEQASAPEPVAAASAPVFKPVGNRKKGGSEHQDRDKRPPKPRNEVDPEALRKKEADKLKSQGHQVTSSGMRKVEINMDFGAIGSGAAPVMPPYKPPSITTPIAAPVVVAPTFQAAPLPTATPSLPLGGLVGQFQGFSAAPGTPASDTNALVGECRQLLQELSLTMNQRWSDASMALQEAGSAIRQMLLEREMALQAQLQTQHSAEHMLIAKRQTYLSSNASRPDAEVQLRAFKTAMKDDLAKWGQPRFVPNVSAIKSAIKEYGVVNSVQTEPQGIPAQAPAHLNGGGAPSVGPGGAQPQRKRNRNKNRKKPTAST